MSQDPEGEGRLHTVGLPEQVRAETNGIKGVYGQLYHRVDTLIRELANPNLHDIANMHSRVELWTADGQHVRWAVAATANITIGQAAFEAAIEN